MDAKPLHGKGAVSSKSKYMFQDIQRVAKFAKVPLRVPESPLYMMFVVGSLRQQRFLTGTRMMMTLEVNSIDLPKNCLRRILGRILSCIYVVLKSR